MQNLGACGRSRCSSPPAGLRWPAAAATTRGARARARARARLRAGRAPAAGRLPALPQPRLRVRTRRPRPRRTQDRCGRARDGVHAAVAPWREHLPPVLALLPRLEHRLGGLGQDLGAQPPAAAARQVLRGTRDYPGFHADDWEGYQLRIDPDGRPWARASSHRHYQGCKQSICRNRWVRASGWTRVSRGSHAGHIPGRLSAPHRSRLRFRPALPGVDLRERTSTGEGLRLIPLESARPARVPPAGRLRHAPVAEGGVPATRRAASPDHAARADGRGE